MMSHRRLTSCTLIVLFAAQGGCIGRNADTENAVITADRVVMEIERLRNTVRPMPPEFADSALFALSSGDSGMRAEAAMSVGKSKQVTRAVSQQLEYLAVSDTDPVARGAAISALFELGQPSVEIIEVTERLRGDPCLGVLATRLSATK